MGWALAASVVALAVAVVVYGVAPLLLAHPDGADLHPLRSRHWWLGTGAQGIGFVASFIARHALPLLLVQPAITLGLGVTTGLQARRLRQRISAVTGVAIVALCLGVGGLGAVSLTRTAGSPSGGLVISMIVATLLGAAGVLAGTSVPAVPSGVLAGVAFSVTAVLARVLAAHPLRIVTHLAYALLAVLMILATGLAQVLLTRALRTAHLTGPLAAMYLVEVVVPAVVGLASHTDAIRPGSWPLAIVALAVAAAAAAVLAIRTPHAAGDHESEPGTTLEPHTPSSEGP